MVLIQKIMFLVYKLYLSRSCKMGKFLSIWNVDFSSNGVKAFSHNYDFLVFSVSLLLKDSLAGYFHRQAHLFENIWPLLKLLKFLIHFMLANKRLFVENTQKPIVSYVKMDIIEFSQLNQSKSNWSINGPPYFSYKMLVIPLGIFDMNSGVVFYGSE